MRVTDVRHLACPGPVITCRQLLEAGERELRLHVADELARSNVTRFAASRGATVSSEPHPAGGWLVTVAVRGDAPAPAPTDEADPACETVGSGGRSLVVQVSSDRMGDGDPELGALLMRSFLKTLKALPQAPWRIVFYNGGVRLCCEESPLLADLQALEAEGVEILSCGTCLNFFGLAPRLRAGRVTDMLEIGATLASAGHILRP